MVVPVGSFAKSIVATAILVMVIPNARGEGCGQRLTVFTISRIGVVAVIGDGDCDLGLIRPSMVGHDSQLESKAAGWLMKTAMLLLWCPTLWQYEKDGRSALTEVSILHSLHSWRAGAWPFMAVGSLWTRYAPGMI